MGSWPKSHLSPGQIAQKCYDANTDRIRVDAQYTSTLAGDLEISIDATHDSVAIKNSVTGNELTVNADGSINVDISNISATKDNIAIENSITGNQLAINPDGSLNVIIESGATTPQIVTSSFGAISGVAAGIETLIVSYTVPAGKTGRLQSVEFDGDNVATYSLYINATLMDRRRTYFTILFGEMDFRTGDGGGLPFVAGDVLTLKVLHNRPYPGSFEGRIQVVNIG